MSPRTRYPANRPDLASSLPDDRRASGVGDVNRRGEFATVTAYQSDKYTASVRTERGRTLTGVGRLRSSPGDIATIPVGTTVLITYEYGVPLILGIFDMPAADMRGPVSMAVGVEGFGGLGTDAATMPTTGNFRGVGEPPDLIPGDWVHAHPDGAQVGVFGGGIAALQSSHTAAVRTHLLNNLVEIIARNYRQYTDMGKFVVENVDGRLNMSFRGAVDQITEAGSDEENWTIQMDLGAAGDIFRFEITTPQGQTLFRMHVNAEGRCELFGMDGLVLHSGSRNGSEHHEVQTGDSRTEIGGTRTLTVDSDLNETVQGSARRQTVGDASVAAGNDAQLTGGRDLGLSAGRNAYIAIAGDNENPALTVDVYNGDYNTHLGSPTHPESSFALSAIAGDITLKTNTGDVLLETNTGTITHKAMKVIAETQAPDSVVLGGTTLRSHVVTFEELATHLNAVYQALDMHTHTSGSPGYPTSPPIAPIAAPHAAGLARARSQRVGVGG